MARNKNAALAQFTVAPGRVLNHDGADYAEGDVVEMAAEAAQPLIAIGVLLAPETEAIDAAAQK